VSAALAGQGYGVKRCCRILDLEPSSYFGWRNRPPSQLELRRERLRGPLSSQRIGRGPPGRASENRHTREASLVRRS
jgi:hypothetical protein